MAKIAREKMVVKGGKLVYAISLEEVKEKGGSNSAHIYIYNGQLTFSDNGLYSASEFDLGDETHRIAKEIFMVQLQADIKSKLMELKQLEEVISFLGLTNVLGGTLPELSNRLWGNRKLLADTERCYAAE